MSVIPKLVLLYFIRPFFRVDVGNKELPYVCSIPHIIHPNICGFAISISKFVVDNKENPTNRVLVIFCDFVKKNLENENSFANSLFQKGKYLSREIAFYVRNHHNYLQYEMLLKNFCKHVFVKNIDKENRHWTVLDGGASRLQAAGGRSTCARPSSLQQT
jgi:hypothetical protein